MRQLFPTALLLLLCTLTTRAADLPLVADGSSPYTIVLPVKATPAEHRGAEELRSHLKQMSGAELPVIDDVQPLPAHAILLGGSNRHLAALNVKLDPATLGEEGFVLRTVADHVVVAATGKRGTMYGCTTLLEMLGVRWFTPTITHIPKRKNVTIPPLDETQIPAFEYREPFIKDAFEKNWAARLRTNGQHAALDESTGGKMTYGAFCHTLDALVPRDLFATHPEYFPLINGKRTSGYVQRCISNPDVLKMSIEKVRTWMRNSPHTIFSVSQNDAHSPCECDACKAIEQKYGHAHSALYIWFCNQIGAAIEKEFPDKLIDTIAYQFTEAAPAGITPRANVRIRLCPIAVCETHPYESCSHPSNVAFIERLAKWSAITDKLYIWHYNIQFHHYLAPFPDFRQFPDSLKLYRRSGVKGVMFQGSHTSIGGSDGEMRAYVMAKLLWNPDADADALVTEWMQGVYGEAAAKPMKRWFDLVHDAATKNTDLHLHVHTHLNPKPGLPMQYFTPELLAEGWKLHEEAERAAAGNPTALAQLAKAKLWLRYVQIWKDQPTGPELDKFVADLAKHGVTHTGEPWDLKQWIGEFRAKWKAAKK